MSEHPKPQSPLPWRVFGEPSDVQFGIECEKRLVVARGWEGDGGVEYREDAEYLVLAANSFPGLVEALRLFVDLCPRVSDDDPISPALCDAVRKARAALSSSEDTKS